MKPRTTGIKGSDHNHDLLTLLDSASDSDGLEPLNLPPIKGKKPKRRRSNHEASSPTKLCTVWGFTKAFSACIVLAAVFGLSLLTYTLWTEVNELKSKYGKVETSNQGAPEELHKLATRVQEMNKTLHTFRSGTNGLDPIIKNLTEIVAQIKELNKSTQSLQSSVKAAPELMAVPIRVETLSKTVAGLGSELKTVESKMDTFQETTESQLADIQLKLRLVQNASSSAPSASVGPLPPPLVSLSQGLDAVRSEIKAVNTSILSKLAILTADVNSQNIQLLSIANQTELLLSDHIVIQSDHKGMTPGGDANQQDIEKIVMGMLTQMGITGSNEDNNLGQDGMIPRVNNITRMVEALNRQFEQLQQQGISEGTNTSNFLSRQNFDTFVIQHSMDMQTLNTTTVALTSDVDKLYTLFSQVKNDWVILNATVVGLKNYMQAKEDQLATGNENPVIAETQTDDTFSSLKIKSIKSYEDLENNFIRWDKDGDGLVVYSDLPDFLGDETPNEKELQVYDDNHDNKYSMEEMSAALGLTPAAPSEGGSHIMRRRDQHELSDEEVRKILDM